MMTTSGIEEKVTAGYTYYLNMWNAEDSRLQGLYRMREFSPLPRIPTSEGSQCDADRRIAAALLRQAQK